ncbi:MAG: hypothetical protein COY80_05155 [Candidatus Pacebacteria bacterium CG_4_10_14_0_8_um_filter_42_14]|nr:MAG: hypothetical protein COY80_05155 [Candidatus Pacebacteria bacterium CG_4_10_14_0_8_um_filter_42_14]
MFNPRYRLTHTILNNLTQISDYRSFILNAKLVPKWEINLRIEALIRSTHASTSIEGNPLSFGEVSNLLIGRDVLALSKDKQEVINYFSALERLGSLTVKKQPILSNQDILELHRAITKGVLKNKKHEGKYRIGNEYVLLRNRNSGEVTFLPPPTKDVPKLMTDLIEWINFSQQSAIDPILQAGIVHYEFVRIHPFLDGNGRTSRALATLILIRRGFDTKRFFTLDDFYNSDRQRYYQVLKSVHQQDYDLTEWLEYFTEGVLISLKAVKEKIIKLGGLKKQNTDEPQISLAYNQMIIVEFANKNGSITNREVRKLLGVSNKTAYQELRKLMSIDVLFVEGSGRNVRYVSKQTKLTPLKLTTFEGIQGYFMSNIRNAMPSSQLKKFVSWISGQTVMMRGNDTFIYQADMERFLRELRELKSPD